MTSRELLMTGARELGVPLTDGQADQLLRFLVELDKWNRKINLTAITSERDAVIKHLLDSLSYLRGFEPGPGRLLDMGSGAGLPALPIVLARPDLSATLVESVKKKCSFLRHAVRTLGLDARVEVLDVRTDEVPGAYDNRYSVVTARAFADMATALAAGIRFLGPGGLAVLSRGPEETLGTDAAARAGFVVTEQVTFALPHSDNKRALWVFRKQ